MSTQLTALAISAAASTSAPSSDTSRPVPGLVGIGVMENRSGGDFQRGDLHKSQNSFQGNGQRKMYGSDQQQLLQRNNSFISSVKKSKNSSRNNNNYQSRLSSGGPGYVSNNRNGMSVVKSVSGGSGGGRYSSGSALSELIVSRYEEYVEEDGVNGGSGGYYEDDDGGGGDGAYHQDDYVMDYEGQDDYDEYDNNGEGYVVDNGHNDEDDEYPDTLQFCEAQFDEGCLEDDEEARGLPPPPTRGNYYDSEGSVGNASKPRITTNESGIRIVESSTVLEPEAEDDVEYDRYGDYGADSLIPMSSFIPSTKRAQSNGNKGRKMRPEKAAAEAILRQLRNSEFDYKPNILAKKLMGLPSQAVQPSRPPPLTKKPVKLMEQQQMKPSQQISLESILRQKQRPQVQNFSSRPKANSLLLNHSQLKIKSSHAIPSTTSISVSNARQQSAAANNKSAPRFQQQSKNSLPSSRLFVSSQPSASTLKSSLVRSSTKIQNFQQFQQQQPSSAQFRGRSLVAADGSSSTPRLSISSIQQQLQSSQKNGVSMKPLKNVPRCHVCKRTFATNQVLQRHMALHGPIATIAESETGEFKCDICLEEFQNPFHLAKHIQTAHQEGNSSASASSSPPSSSSGQQGLHRCRVCYRTFTCLDSLKAHSLLHDGDFKCRACRRGFPDWNSLEEHEATHKKYNCQWCEKYFMNSGNLKAHERIHTGERPYRCNDCPKAFKQLGGLQYHLKTNPTHKPQKYHKGDMDGTDGGNNGNSNGDSSSGGGAPMGYMDPSMLQYESGDEEDYDDGGNLSILDLAAGAGF